MKTVLILGLDSFGATLATSLAGLGVEVLIADFDEEVVQRARDRFALAVVADARDREALTELCARQPDLAVVSLGPHIEASVLSTLLLKELGVPQILACARNDDHEKVLRKVGADRVVQPVTESAERMARSLASKNLADFVLVGEDFAIVELPVPENWVGKSLKELDLRRRFRVTAIAIKRHEADGTERVAAPDPDQHLPENVSLLMIGLTKDLAKIERLDPR
ncbi:MAG: TrkA family potassium uptake protein [Planctomycetes bacterium]|nr:TrkA family potassium uptake protein [Planctomycetota bacterium]